MVRTIASYERQVKELSARVNQAESKLSELKCTLEEADYARNQAESILDAVFQQAERWSKTESEIYRHVGFRLLDLINPWSPSRQEFTTIRGETLSTCSLDDLEVLRQVDAVPTGDWAHDVPTKFTSVALAELAKKAR
jgi:hypothetical protein